MLDMCCLVLAGSRERLLWRLNHREVCAVAKQYSGNADISWAKQLVKTGSLMCDIALFVTLPGLSSSSVTTAAMETSPHRVGP
jgi:hypothetical protein